MAMFPLLLICGLTILLVGGVGAFLVLLKLGVIVREAARPPQVDYGNYSLDQGREMRPEEQQKQR